MDETQNDAPFVAFYDMHAVTFVPPDEMADVTIAGLQWFILIPPIKPRKFVSCKQLVQHYDKDLWRKSHLLALLTAILPGICPVLSMLFNLSTSSKVFAFAIASW